MWRIWKEEFRKMASRRIFWIGLALLLAFVTFHLWAQQEEYSVTINGKQFYGREAIKKDQELTAEYAGKLTEEKGQQIYEKYGVYDPETEESGEKNFCSQFITYWMTNYHDVRNGDSDELRLYEGEEWKERAKLYWGEKFRFDYAYGWENLQEIYGVMVIQGTAVLILILLSPVFAEEYALRTTPILLSTWRGKGGGIWMKISAAIIFSIIVFFMVTLYVWGIYIAVYGVQGLDASISLLDVLPLDSAHFACYPSTIGGFFLFMFFQGLAGVLLLDCMVLAVSAMCVNSFLTVVVSLALYFLPCVCMPQHPLSILRSDKASVIARCKAHIISSTPQYLSAGWTFGFSKEQLILHLGIALAAGIVCVMLGYLGYRNHQG